MLQYLLLLLLAVTQARPPIRLVLEHQIDDSSGPSLGAIERFELTADGGVVAVDGANGVIYRFTPAGKLRDSLGHKGQGPGEFLVAAGLGVGPAGEVALVDIRTRRFTIWEPDGKLRGSTPLAGFPVDLVWRGAEPLVATVHFADTVMISFGPARLGESKPGPATATFPDPPIAQYATAVSCGSCRHTLSPAGNLLVAAPDTFYRVSELDAAGKSLRTWRRVNVGAGLRTKEELAALRKRLMAGPGGGRPLPGMETRFRAPDDAALRFRSRFQGIGMDDKGRLLALVSNAGSSNPVIDVFSGEGRFLGTIEADRSLQAMVVRGNRLAALGETSDGTPALLVYRIEEVPPH
jgi:hypothetical protein